MKWDANDIIIPGMLILIGIGFLVLGIYWDFKINGQSDDKVDGIDKKTDGKKDKVEKRKR